MAVRDMEHVRIGESGEHMEKKNRASVGALRSVEIALPDIAMLRQHGVEVLDYFRVGFSHSALPHDVRIGLPDGKGMAGGGAFVPQDFTDGCGESLRVLPGQGKGHSSV